VKEAKLGGQKKTQNRWGKKALSRSSSRPKSVCADSAGVSATFLGQTVEGRADALQFLNHLASPPPPFFGYIPKGWNVESMESFRACDQPAQHTPLSHPEGTGLTCGAVLSCRRPAISTFAVKTSVSGWSCTLFLAFLIRSIRSFRQSIWSLDSHPSLQGSRVLRRWGNPWW